MIPPLCATLGPVLAGPEGCSRGRWRSGPSKWRHTAAPEGRGQGAPRTCRCIETRGPRRAGGAPPVVREHHAPVGALRHKDHPGDARVFLGQGAPRTCRCIETLRKNIILSSQRSVREHHAPAGALRQESGYREARRISSVVRTRLTERSWGHPPHRPVSSATPLSHCYASYPSATPLFLVQ